MHTSGSKILTVHGRGGFTLIELLVVITIIALLIAILIPSISQVQRSANKSSTKALLSSIAKGIDAYHQDFNMYPPSQPNGTLTRGSMVLAQALTGYLTGGIHMRAGGASYGPYAPAGGDNWANAQGSTTYKAFVDLWGNEVLYYRAVPNLIGGQRRAISEVFGTTASSTSLPDASFNGYFVAGDNSGSPTTAATSTFWPLVGSTSGSNTFNGGDTILGSNSFLLLSGGADGVYFDSDDIPWGGS